MRAILTAPAGAAGQLRVFSLPCELELDAAQLLVDVIVSDGAELQQVNTCAWLTVGQLRAVFAAAPRLQVLAHSEIPESHTIRIGPILKGAAS